jgi:hypothetical protein
MVREIKCVHCGTVNPLPAEVCRVCGMPIESPEKGHIVCPNCGSEENLVGAHKCVDCGFVLTSLPKVPDQPRANDDACEHTFEQPAHVGREARVYMAAILILLAGALGIAHALLASLPGTENYILVHYHSIIPAGAALDDIIDNSEVYGALMFVFGMAAVAMSTFAFNRTRYWWAIAAAVFGVLSVGFLIGSFLAIVSIIILASAHREFLPECKL